VLWFTNAAIQTLQKRTRLIACGSAGGLAAGPGTEQMLLQCAAKTLGVVVSGGHIVHGTRRSKLTRPNQASGLEVKFQAELARAAAGLKRTDVNDVVNQLMKKYEGKSEPERAPEGMVFEELYDLKSLKPRPEYLEIYNKVKKDLEELSIPV